ncbi:TonB-dependent receptor [Gammaproteobacteria bacterium]|nr:TonB-dependent receptor [Gammaproteobacteria bacterium]
MFRSLLSLSVAATLAAPLLAQQDDDEVIVIRGGRIGVATELLGTAHTVIDRKTIEQSGASNVADVLKRVPGVAIGNLGGPGTLTEIRMRGSESNQVLVFIDGIRVNDPASGDRFDFAHLPIADIERIEVLRGEQSALWGSAALGGVINITTRQGGGETRVNASLSGDTFGGFTLGGGVRGGAGVLDYALRLDYEESDGFSAADDDRFAYTLPDGSTLETGGATEDDAYDNTTVALKLGAAISENVRLDGVMRHTDFTSHYDGFSNTAIDDEVARTDGTQTQYQTTLGYTPGQWAHSLQWMVNESDSDFVSGFGDSNSKGEREQFSYQLDYRFDDALKQQMTVALEKATDSADSTFAGFNEIESESIVGEYRIAPGAHSLGVSLRHDSNERFEDASTWRLSWAMQANAAMRWHASLGTGVKNPTLTEIFGFSPEFVGNESLKPEESLGGDIGLAFSPTGAQQIDVTYFHREISDLITGAGNTAINTAGESTSRGIEVSIDQALSEQFDLGVAYTWNDTEDADGNQLVRRPEHSATVNLDWSVPGDSLNLGLELVAVAGRNDLVFNDDFTPILVDMDDYQVLNANATWALANGIELYSRLDNLLDEAYQSSVGYGGKPLSARLGVRGEF